MTEVFNAKHAHLIEGDRIITSISINFVENVAASELLVTVVSASV